MQQVQQWLFLIFLTLALCACKGSNQLSALLNQGGQNEAEPSPLPHLIAELPLATADAALLDFRFGPAAQQLYVTDTAGQLYIVDAVNYTLLATLPATGTLTLDEQHDRLYVAPGAGYFTAAASLVITVIDTKNHTIIGTIPGRQIAVDPIHNRLFVGDPVTADAKPDEAGIRLYDGATLAQTGKLAQAGLPFYNPLRDELLVMAHTVYAIDLATGQVTSDLFPKLAEQPLLWCNGCSWADEVHIFPETNLIAIYVRAHCMGGGCDLTGPPTFFDATTLQPLTAMAHLPEVQSTCSSARVLTPAIGGRTYRTYAFQRYVTFTNLLVYDDTGALVTWRDGLLAHFINPQTAQAYLAGGDVLDLATLTPVGHWPASCVFAYDETRGLLYAAGPVADGAQGTLWVIAQQGGASTVTPAPAPAALPGHSITTILPSPAYANDKTLLIRADPGLLFRSTDGADSWQLLQGGLPQGEPLNLQVAFSPNYGTDRTIYAAGYRNEGRGEGVWRSTDGGDTWQPLWQGLTHLRLTELLLSPHFANDQTVLVKGEYNLIVPAQSGTSWQRSTDGGLHWSVVATSTYAAPLPAATTLLPALAEPVMTLPVHLTDYSHRVEYTPDQGVTWLPVALPVMEGEWLQTLIAAPTQGDTADLPVIYVMGDYHLWRTSDGGRQWQQWVDPLGAPRTYTNAFRSLAVSPPLADGAYHLFLGTTDGQLLMPDLVAPWLAVTP